MASLKRRIKNALQETRFLLLGAQVMLAFQGRAALLPGYEDLSPLSQSLCYLGLFPAVILLTLLLAPLPFHKIAEEGCNSERLHRFATEMARWGLFTFALSLGINLTIAADRIFPLGLAIGLGVGITVLSLGAWFGVEAWASARNKGKFSSDGQKNMNDKKDEDEIPELSERIDQTLSEGSMVVPGNTALLGFGFITMLLESFTKLPFGVQIVQFVGVCMIALSTVLLMTPAAYHRLVEHGEDSEDFYKMASRLLILALIPFALGINASLYVIAYQVTKSYTVATISAACTLLFAYGLWFGYTYLKRQSRKMKAETC